MPGVPKFTLLGFALAYAINSATLFTGSSLLTTSANGPLTTVVTAARSLLTS